MDARTPARQDDDAVSPVIAVILLVAITVVLGATLYTWVGDFNAGQRMPDKSISLVSNDAYDDTLFVKEYVAATGVGLRYGDISVTLDGAPLTLASAAADDRWYVQRGGAVLASPATETVKAGDVLVLNDDADMDGKTLRVVDRNANFILVSLVVR